MKQFIFVVILIVNIQFAGAQDTINIPYIKKKIILPGENAFFSFSKNDRTFLLTEIYSDTLRCYEFRNNDLICTGRLFIKKPGDQKIALRNGYWIYLEKGIRQRKILYVNDRPNHMKLNIPTRKNSYLEIH